MVVERSFSLKSAWSPLHRQTVDQHFDGVRRCACEHDVVGEVTQRANDPKSRLLAIFDVFDGWFHRDDFEDRKGY